MVTLWLSDFHHSVRTLRREPLSWFAIVLTLGLGLGVNAAVFSFVEAVLLRPLPAHEPERLVVLWESDLSRSRDLIEVSLPNFLDWRRDARELEEMAAMGTHDWAYVLLGEGEPTRVPYRAVSASFFDTVRVAFGGRSAAARQFPHDGVGCGAGARTVAFQRVDGGRVRRPCHRPRGDRHLCFLARSVVERSREIAVRMALGVARLDVIRSVVARAARWTSAGLALGFAAAVIGSRLVTNLLFQVSATNPWFFGFVFACIAAVALGASVVPAWRAARLDPIELLRAD